jgi:hypothetical protein
MFLPSQLIWGNLAKSVFDLIKTSIYGRHRAIHLKMWSTLAIETVQYFKLLLSKFAVLIMMENTPFLIFVKGVILLISLPAKSNKKQIQLKNK